VVQTRSPSTYSAVAVRPARSATFSDALLGRAMSRMDMGTDDARDLAVQPTDQSLRRLEVQVYLDGRIHPKPAPHVGG